MTAPRVRVSGPAGADIRRRPRQQRAQISAQALQQAFVRVLLERGYAKTTIREVAAVAGVGVGTFYEYFGNMRSLAAKWISDSVRDAEREVRLAVAQSGATQTAEVVDVMLDQMVRGIARDLPTWAALFLLERQISSVKAYQGHYEDWVRMWQECLGDAHPPVVGRMAHVIAYGWLSQCLIAQGEAVDVRVLRAELGRAVQGYLAPVGLSLKDLQTKGPKKRPA